MRLKCVPLPTDRVYDGRDMSAVLLDNTGTVKSSHEFLFFYGGCSAADTGDAADIALFDVSAQDLIKYQQYFKSLDGSNAGKKEEHLSVGGYLFFNCVKCTLIHLFPSHSSFFHPSHLFRCDRP